MQAIEEARADQDRRDAARKLETVEDKKRLAAYKAAQVSPNLLFRIPFGYGYFRRALR